MEGAPKLVELLEGADAEHFAAVRAHLDAIGIGYTIDPTLVRGLDYYTRTIFSFVCDRLGAQAEIGGGGRYDGLIEQLGGPATPAVGWAAGIERILLALGDADAEGGAEPTVFISFDWEGTASERALAIASELRGAGYAAEIDLAGRGQRGQLKHANRLGAKLVVFLDESGGAELRDMSSGEQHPVEIGSLVEEIGAAT